ncbi:acyl-CoA thioesterase [Solimonas marina]|uniref:Acyl-CoA thioesterase n=1 Tax=Solimonas marina TaxID=2714601 RepID=A0A970B373_9GAMM|nr:thioesterase family protein [Solimonas marina]NKF20932.1 acyl-CoA thioesterase [Solimonas marina]
MPAKSAASSTDTHAFWIEERVRFTDLDLQGHVNNTAFNIYAESVRTAFFHEVGLLQLGGPRQNVVARFEMDYLREVRYPAVLRIGLRVLNIGTRSFLLGIDIFEGGTCVANALTTMVRWDREARGSTPLTGEEKTILTRYM